MKVECTAYKHHLQTSYYSLILFFWAGIMYILCTLISAWLTSTAIIQLAHGQSYTAYHSPVNEFNKSTPNTWQEHKSINPTNSYQSNVI